MPGRKKKLPPEFQHGFPIVGMGFVVIQHLDPKHET